MYRATESSCDRSSDAVVPPRENADNGFSATRVGAVNEDHPDLERVPVEGGLLQECDNGHDAVIAAQIVVEPEFVDQAVSVFFEELDAFLAGAGDPRGPG